MATSRYLIQIQINFFIIQAIVNIMEVLGGLSSIMLVLVCIGGLMVVFSFTVACSRLDAVILKVGI